MGAVVQLVIAAALGSLVLAAYRRARRSSPPAAAIMAAGILLRALLGLALFWTSYLDLPVLRNLHTRDGFWAVAADASIYYRDAAVVAAAPEGMKAPLFTKLLAVWMRAVGWSPASGLFLNVLLFTLLAVLVIEACRPFTDRVASRACLAALVPFAFAPVLLVHGTQLLKDELFVVMLVATCLMVRALFAVRPAGVAVGWPSIAFALIALAAVSKLMSGVRVYFVAFACASLIPCALVYVRRSGPSARWRSIAIAAAAFVAACGPLVYGPGIGPRLIPADPAAPVASPVLNMIVRARQLSVHGGGASNIVTAAEPDAGTVRATLRGLAVVFVPVSVAGALGWVQFPGGRGLLWITDIDTILLDAFMIGAVALVVSERRRLRPHAPYVWFLAALAISASLVLGYVVTNFGTLVRLRLMIAAPIWLLPLATATAPSGGDAAARLDAAPVQEAC